MTTKQNTQNQLDLIHTVLPYYGIQGLCDTKTEITSNTLTDKDIQGLNTYVQTIQKYFKTSSMNLYRTNYTINKHNAIKILKHLLNQAGVPYSHLKYSDEYLFSLEEHNDYPAQYRSLHNNKECKVVEGNTTNENTTNKHTINPTSGFWKPGKLNTPTNEQDMPNIIETEIFATSTGNKPIIRCRDYEESDYRCHICYDSKDCLKQIPDIHVNLNVLPKTSSLFNDVIKHDVTCSHNSNLTCLLLDLVATGKTIGKITTINPCMYNSASIDNNTFTKYVMINQPRTVDVLKSIEMIKLYDVFGDEIQVKSVYLCCNSLPYVKLNLPDAVNIQQSLMPYTNLEFQVQYESNQDAYYYLYQIIGELLPQEIRLKKQSEPKYGSYDGGALMFQTSPLFEYRYINIFSGNMNDSFFNLKQHALKWKVTDLQNCNLLRNSVIQFVYCSEIIINSDPYVYWSFKKIDPIKPCSLSYTIC